MAIQETLNRLERFDGALATNGASELKRDVSAESSAGAQAVCGPAKNSGYKEDSWRLHVLYVLGSLAIGAPFFIPGIPHRALFVTYFAVATVAMLALMIWGVIREVRNAWRVRKWR